ncbi:hypothetical protein AB833_25815 [Chromatiales bacterium (ex Bugula neritina AB1)]|nr:hypothetical protein AB833_25815 [Chromatiales bacterium (ex Bugula neritina AB1)]
MRLTDLKPDQAFSAGEKKAMLAVLIPRRPVVQELTPYAVPQPVFGWLNDQITDSPYSYSNKVTLTVIKSRQA